MVSSKIPTLEPIRRSDKMAKHLLAIVPPASPFLQGYPLEDKNMFTFFRCWDLPGM